MSSLVLLAKLLLVGVFVVSAVAKLRDPDGSRKAVVDFGVPAAMATPVAKALPAVELLCAALLLLPGLGATAGAAAAVLLLTGFTVAIVANLIRGRQPDCHCFGQIGGGAISWRSVVRNAGLLVLAVLALLDPAPVRSVPADIASYSAGRVAVGVVLLLLTAAVVILAAALRTLTARYGTVLLRLDALEIATGTAPPRQAPAFSLPDLDGRVVSTEDAFTTGRPVLLVFLSATCALCSDLLPSLSAWQDDAQHPVATVVLSTGDAAANREKLGESRLQVLLQTDFEVADHYGVPGTPAAVLVNSEGFIASPVAQGLEAVVALHDSALRTLAGAPDEGAALHQIGQRPVDVGDTFPDVQVQTDEGAAVTLAEVTREPTVLLFWRTDCGFCAQILADVVQMQEDEVPAVLVSTTPTEALRHSGLVLPVLREPDGALTTALRVPGTPAAVRVVAGVVDSSVAVGGPEVLALLSATRLASHPA